MHQEISVQMMVAERACYYFTYDALISFSDVSNYGIIKKD